MDDRGMNRGMDVFPPCAPHQRPPVLFLDLVIFQSGFRVLRSGSFQPLPAGSMCAAAVIALLS